MPVWVGTSGWQYRDWRGAFYPQKGPQVRWLERYAEAFATVELNNSFYRLPERATFAQWAQRTPGDFVVAVKASRYLTHIKRLRDPAEPVGRLLDHARGLGRKLGPVLVQLPPTLAADVTLLDAALAVFHPGVRVAVEFRHASWFCEPVREVLAARGAALCLADRDARWLTPRWRTANWGFVRFHWGTGDPDPCYRPSTLEQRAREVAETWRDGEDVYTYFNNDPRCCAVHDAVVFAGACERAGMTPTRVPQLDEVTVVV